MHPCPRAGTAASHHQHFLLSVQILHVPYPHSKTVFANCKLSVPLCSTDNLQFLFTFPSPPRSCSHASRVGIAASHRQRLCHFPHKNKNYFSSVKVSSPFQNRLIYRGPFLCPFIPAGRIMSQGYTEKCLIPIFLKNALITSFF